MSPRLSPQSSPQDIDLRSRFSALSYIPTTQFISQDNSLVERPSRLYCHSTGLPSGAHMQNTRSAGNMALDGNFGSDNKLVGNSLVCSMTGLVQ